ncbi:hypothetical protein CC86DRAFT_410988 [Ophiobolus disseminans]|uniref:HCP-like protein n=1 Tax=Ophiobolus disseminans TaxID=1469910 RepID=A0A6A6ZM23_9PLEO|nr:hypothetical protein CC86DRAFT_410988 [Ophiobolus disseminans]
MPMQQRKALNNTGFSRGYATPVAQKLDVKRLRHDIDERARLGFYTLTKKQGALLMERDVANAIVKEFLAKQNTMDHSSNVRHLTSKYKTSLENISSLAIVTFLIPDLSDPTKRAQLPPSKHKPLAASILKGCAELEDPLAILQIMTAVYLAAYTGDQSYKDIATLFSRNEILKYRKILEKLGEMAQKIALGPEALTLQGLLLEGDGNKEKAKLLYIKAVELCHFKYTPGSRHPMQLPIMTPWNALGYLLKADNDPSIRAQAKAYFQRGALEGDDPVSCFEAAQSEDRSNPKWLQFTSKAAASGHRQATINLAQFYHDVSLEGSSVLATSSMQKALNWLLRWRRGSTANLAREWQQAASIMGHKPSSLQLTEHRESIGDKEGAKQFWKKLGEPKSGKAEK